MKAPEGLQDRGARFWKLISETYDLSPPELELLLETARTLDLVERLEDTLSGGTDTKVAAELRQQRLALGRLLGQLQIPSEAIESAKTVRAKKAAASRWQAHTRRAEA